MKDIIIKVFQYGNIYASEGSLGINCENLQGRLIFEFEDYIVTGTGYLEFERDDEKGLIPLTYENEQYYLEIKDSLLKKEGIIKLQLRVTEDTIDGEIPVFKSEVFELEVKEAINATTEIPDEYPEWIDLANAKIKEMDNLNITTERVEGGVNIKVTEKDGTETITKLNDGQPGPAGQQGEPGAVKMDVVDTLPETGKTDTIYLLKKENTSDENLYEEYVYISTGWEHIGDTSVDLSDYYTKEETDIELRSKQDKLIPGDGIEIGEDNVINSTIEENPTKIYETITAYLDKNFGSYLNKDDLSNIITSMYNDNVKYPILRLKYKPSSTLTIKNFEYRDFTFDYNTPITSKLKRYNLLNLASINIHGEPSAQPFNNTLILGLTLIIDGKWDNDVFTCNSASSYAPFSNDINKIALTTNVLTKTNTDTYLPSKDYHPATKKYVDDSINNIQLPDTTYIINTQTTDEEKITIMQVVFDKYTSGNMPNLTYVNENGEVFSLFDVDKFETHIDFFMINGGQASMKYGIGYYAYDRYKINCTYSEGTITSVSIEELSDTYMMADNSQILGINNTTEFTPEFDYQPSTKKYVDDAISTAINKTLEGSY